MRTEIRSRRHRVLNAARLWLSSAWSKLTDNAFLTLMIAVGTLATALVAYKTAQDSHEQVQLLKRQVEFNSTETRPFVRLKPIVSSEAPLRPTLGMVNVGRIPARVLAYDLMVQIGPRLIEPKGGTFNTQDILYPDQPGLGVFQALTQEQAAPFLKGAEPIVIGGCLIYASITADDTRRWKVSAAYRWNSPSDPPLGLFANEGAVTSETTTCDAGLLRDEWGSQLKTHPK